MTSRRHRSPLRVTGCRLRRRSDSRRSRITTSPRSLTSFQIAKVPGFVRDTINNKFAIVVSLDFLQIKSRHRRARHDGKTRDVPERNY
jgi:hypothetical protein